MKNNNSKKLHAFLYTAIGLGVGIRFFQFFYNRSLWYDEATLALNIIEKDFWELVLPLDYNQVAPILYLFLQKGTTLILGDYDFVLRISSLVGGLLFLYLSYQLSKLLLNHSGGLITTAILSLSYPLIYYTSEAKPYILDALTFVILFLFYFKSNKNKKWKIYFSVAGVFSVWFSFSSIFVLTSLGLLAIMENPILKISLKKFTQLCWMHLPWVLSFLFSYYFIISGHSNSGQMTKFWDAHFMPSVFPIDEFIVWNAVHFVQLFYTILGFDKIVSILGISIFIYALYFMIKTKKTEIVALCFPLFLHLILSHFHIFPFAERLILYSAFTIAFFISVGLTRLYDSHLLPKEIKKLYFVLIAILLTNLSFVSIKKLPIEREEIKLALEILNEKIEPTDNLYIYYGAVPAIKFHRNDLLINEDKIVYGNEYRDSPENYFQEIDQLEGTTWIVCTHYLDEETARIQEEFEQKGEKNIAELKIPNNTSKIYLITEK